MSEASSSCPAVISLTARPWSSANRSMSCRRHCAAVVVEGRYSGLFKSEHVPGAWLGDVLARLQVRYPEVQIVFADSRRFAEEWTYRFLAAAVGDATGTPSDA